MVAKAVCLAIAVKILHGGHVAYLCRNSNAWGEMILPLYAVGNGKGLVGIHLVVQHTHAHVWNDTPSGKSVYIVLVEVAEDIPHEISTQVLVVLRGVVAVVELHTAIVQTTPTEGVNHLPIDTENAGFMRPNRSLHPSGLPRKTVVPPAAWTNQLSVHGEATNAPFM